MINFSIHFLYPWLLLLLIPAVFLTLFPYFRLAKKYRRTRNRIISIICHMIIMILSIATLAGITFNYETINDNNEIILLVDTSFSGDEHAEEKNDFIASIVDETSESFKLGIVTFGFNQVYPAPMSLDHDAVLDQYLASLESPETMPDTTATDIESALNFARGLFTNPHSSKIVLISDGVETDGRAAGVIKSIAAEGIRVDTAIFDTNTVNEEVQLVDVTLPDYNINPGDTFVIGLTLQSSYKGSAHITLYDNDEEMPNGIDVDFVDNIQTFEIEHTIEQERGMHRISFEIESRYDTLVQNNTYNTYLYLEEFDDILIIERDEGDSQHLLDIFDKNTDENNPYNVTVKNAEDLVVRMDDSEIISENDITLNVLREYDEIILNNINNDDLPEGFDQLLNSYVYEVGGGLFTVGGNEEPGTSSNPVAHAYNRENLHGTLLQQMLPVNVIKYTPPKAVMFIIDRSGSMGDGDGSLLEECKIAAMSVLRSMAFTERDYCGVMTLEDTYQELATLTPMPQYWKVEAAIDSISGGGGTNYRPAIEQAGLSLSALSSVDRRHIILLSDGQPSDSLNDNDGSGNDYGSAIQKNFSKGITMTIVQVGSQGKDSEMEMAAEEYGHGKYYKINPGEEDSLSDKLRSDLMVPEIQEVEYKEFTPTIRSYTAVMNGIMQDMMPTLGGFYGTKAKDQAEVSLVGEYGVPIYAQWKYGEGMVGSFMCTLNGDSWSNAFVTDDTGKRFLSNVVNALFPTQDIKPRDIDVSLDEDNYTTKVTVFTKLDEGQQINVAVASLSDDNFVPPDSITQTDNRFSFVIKDPGVYRFTVQKLDSTGNVIEKSVFEKTFKAFSYSKEYNVFVTREDRESLMGSLAENGRGSVIDMDNILDIFNEFDMTDAHVFDPRILFMIIVIILFLLDVAVRKFKFKWIHEIIRDYKEKKKFK